MGDTHEVQHLRRRVALLEGLIDKHTTTLYQKPGHAIAVAMELRRATGLPVRPPQKIID